MISVIIPTYKSPKTLDICLHSLFAGKSADVPIEVIVVVDGYYDVNKDVLKKYEPSITVLDLQTNYGLPRATNMGVYSAKYSNVLIVNDDNVFPSKWNVHLSNLSTDNTVWSINQIEPLPSMFPQFVIQDFGDVNNFKYEEFIAADSAIGVTSRGMTDETGSTLPIYMKRLDFIRLGGWDESYDTSGVVADWDFFLKCNLTGLQMKRYYGKNFYHFTSQSVNGPARYQAELEGHLYAKFKWGDFIKHDPTTNKKYI